MQRSCRGRWHFLRCVGLVVEGGRIVRIEAIDRLCGCPIGRHLPRGMLVGIALHGLRLGVPVSDWLYGLVAFGIRFVLADFVVFNFGRLFS